MEFVISEQLIGVVASLGVGIVAGIFYSIADFTYYLIFGSKGSAGFKQKTGRILSFSFRFITDLILSVIYTLLFSLVSYAHSYGRIRLINIFSFALGAVLYRSFLFRPVSFAFNRMADILRMLLIYLFKAFLLPLGIVFRSFARIGIFIFRITAFKVIRMARISGSKRRSDRIIRSLASTVRFN